MPSTLRTPVETFVALTRAIREEVERDDVRLRAFEVVDRLARSLGNPSFHLEFDVLAALASQDRQIGSALRPFCHELRALIPHPPKGGAAPGRGKGA